MPSGVPKRGTAKYKKIKNLKAAKALLESNTLHEAYMKTHPKSSEKWAKGNCRRMLTPEVIEEVRRVIQIEKVGVATRENIEKLLTLVVSGYLNGTEKTSDFLAALKLMKELMVGIDIPQDEETLNKRLKELGWKPENETATPETPDMRNDL